MKKLSFEEMEPLSGGSRAKVVGCAFGTILMVAGFASLFVVTAGTSAIMIAAAATTASLSPSAWGISCFTDY